MSKHSDLVNVVEKELRQRGYDIIHKNIEYNKTKKGEIDIYAVKNNYILLFEIKCNKHIKSYNKAVDQLYRAERYYFNKKQRVFKFFVYDCKKPKYEKVI
jgi:Holliday junction resolvase-like predicted endonuclease